MVKEVSLPPKKHPSSPAAPSLTQVTAVSDGAFNAHALAAQQGAFAMLESIDSIAQTSMNQVGLTCTTLDG